MRRRPREKKRKPRQSGNRSKRPMKGSKRKTAPKMSHPMPRMRSAPVRRRSWRDALGFMVTSAEAVPFCRMGGRLHLHECKMQQPDGSFFLFVVSVVVLGRELFVLLGESFFIFQASLLVLLVQFAVHLIDKAKTGGLGGLAEFFPLGAYVGEATVKEETIETILKYAEMILEDDCLTEYEIQSIRMLRMFLGVEEGEFAKYGYMDRIERMIIDQMEILYADNKINKKEMLHKSDIQGIFGLGYDEYQEIVNKVAIQAYSRGANMQDLDTYL